MSKPAPAPTAPRPRVRLRVEALDDRITPALAFNGQVGFDTGGANITAVAVADFNGDGRPDVASTAGGSNTISVLVNSTEAGAAPTFFATQGYFASGGPGGIAAGDFNADGRADLVVANSASNTVSVYFNSTAVGSVVPTFLSQQVFAAGANPAAVAVGDFNGDGRADIAVSAGQLAVLVNATGLRSSVASFSTQPITPITNRGSLAVADFNADGRADIATSDSVLIGGGSYINSVRVWSNFTPAGSAAISFAPTPAFTGAAVPTVVVFPLAAGDFDGDGRADLAVTDGGNSVSFLVNQTVPGFLAPTFGGPQTFNLGAAARGAAVVGDFDGDGRTDVAATVAGNAVSVLVNGTPVGSNTLGFGPPLAFGVGPNALAAGAGDFNADGRTDLAAPSGDTSLVSVLANASSAVSVTGPALIGQYGSAGVWRYNRASGTWDQLTASNANALASAANGRVVAAFGSAGVWYFHPTSGWSLINGNPATAVALDALGNVYASFPGFGVAVYRPASGWSSVLTGSVADMLSVNAQGDIAANFPGFGVYRFTPSTGWVRLTDNTRAVSIAIANNGDVAASFTGFGVYQYKSTAGWSQINPYVANTLAFGPDEVVVAHFPGFGVAKYLPAASGWQSIHTGPAATSVAADLYGNLFVVFPGFGVYEHDSYFGFRLRTQSVANLLAVGR